MVKSKQGKTIEIAILILLVIIVVLLSLLLIYPKLIGWVFKEKSYPGYGKTHNVTKVIDGDTIVIEDEESVRLICIDTPEKGEDYFKEAKDFVNEMILGKEVLIENDVSDRDKYQRLLGYIYLNEEFVNEKIVRNGWARAYPYAPDTKLCSIMQEAEKKAKQEKLGMWQEYETPMPSGEYNCTSNVYNCDDFSSQAEAQKVYQECGGIGNDIHRLDSDGDGKVCEGLG